MSEENEFPDFDADIDPEMARDLEQELEASLSEGEQGVNDQTDKKENSDIGEFIVESIAQQNLNTQISFGEEDLAQVQKDILKIEQSLEEVMHHGSQVKETPELLSISGSESADLSSLPEHLKELDRALLNDFIFSLYEESVSVVEDDIDMDILEIANPEIEEHCGIIKSMLDAASEEHESSHVNALKRSLHTLKGALKMVGMNKAGAIAHRVESVLDYCENHNHTLLQAKSLIDTELSSILVLKSLSAQESAQIRDPKLLMLLDNFFGSLASTDHQQSDVSLNEDDKEHHFTEQKLLNKLAQESSAKSINSSSNAKTPDSKSEQDRNSKANDKATDKSLSAEKIIKIKSGVIDSIVNDAGEIRLTRANLEEITTSAKKNSNDLKSTALKLQQILKELEIQAESQMQSKKEQLEQSGENFDPLEFDRFTRLQELTRFMSETAQDIYDSALQAESLNKSQSDILNQQVLLTNNILNELIKVRLVKVDSLSDRLYKIVRSTAKEIGKTVVLELSGESTEVDRVVLDRMFDPLAHIIRNSIAHGIESTEERVKNKKSALGKVKVGAALDGNYIVFTIEDDGAGINIEKIKQIAKNKGLIDNVDNLTEAQATNLIFVSGLSTADSVSQISGRGVGMDVVYTEVRALGGNIKVSTQKSVGSKFVISLPVAVATSQAMLCYNQDNLFAIPTIHIHSVHSFKEEQITSAYENGFLNIDDEKIALYYGAHLLGGPSPLNASAPMKHYNSVIVCEHDGHKIAMHVDRIQNTTDILVKGASSHLSAISGVLGTTLLGDGAQGLIINPVLLLEHWKKLAIDPLWANNKNKSIDNTQRVVGKKSTSDKLKVMVVDDSITVRKVTEKTLLNYGFSVTLAKHGEDALEQLQISTPDIILSDIEMPVMDGFDFVKNVRNNDKYKDIPIIMITSRTAEKHQKYAFSLGANDFIGKPFQEKELIEKIKTLVFSKKSVI